MRRAKEGSARVAVAYIRVSTEEQELGPDAQERAIVRFCAANALRLACVFQDRGVSGASPIDKRPGLLQAIEALRIEGAGVLIVAKRDRIARDLVIAGMIDRLAERNGARVICADGTGNGDGPEAGLLRGVADLFAEYERALIRTRTKAALRVKRERGERCGTVPFGFRLASDRVRLEPDPEETRTLQAIHAFRAAGNTFREIAETLNAQGFPCRGKRWYLQSVHALLSKQAA